MNIGEKIKNIRTAKMITQKEIAGDMITRNMLSRIENGVALPSLPTLLYLSKRLGVPAGYLISDDSESDLYYHKYSNYKNLIKAYKSGEWKICHDLCIMCDPKKEDNELIYFLAKSTLQIAISEFNSGSLRKALPIFEQGCEYAKETVIDTSSVILQSAAYVRFMENISPSFSSELSLNTPFEGALFLDDFCKYERFFASLSDYDPNSVSWQNENYGLHLKAKLQMKNQSYDSAVALLSVISEDDSLPRPVKYMIYRDFEECCKKIGDYKSAYELSEAKIQLFEKMLSQD